MNWDCNIVELGVNNGGLKGLSWMLGIERKLMMGKRHGAGLVGDDEKATFNALKAITQFV